MSLLVTAALALAVQGPLAQRLDSVVSAAEGQGFHGVVLVARQGEVLLSRGYGFANQEAGSRFSPTTLVQIGSGVKDFTKVAIYQLLERGRLRLTDSLARFFPGLPADKGAITVEQLLSHHAGLPLGLGDGDRAALTRDDLLRGLRELHLESAPGTVERYSNLGYALLAAIVEQLSGMPFDRYVSQEIARPAGLTETGSHAMHFDPARIAHGYQGGRDIGTVLDMPHDETGHLYQLRGNGGYLSTLADMQRFYRAVENGPLLRDAANRRQVLRTDEPAVLAGSDLVSFFLFGNFPGAGVEIVIASNHAEYRGNRLLQPMLAALGIRQGPGGPEGPRQPSVTAPLIARLPDTGPGRTVAAYLEAYNSGDTSVMRRFFDEHGSVGPGSAPASVRLQRYQDMWGNLGRLTMRGWRQAAGGEGITVIADGANGETLSLTFVVENAAPFRLLGVRVEVG